MSEKNATGSVVDICDLHVYYKTYAGMVKVLNGVNLHVSPGEKVAIVGETGCGKTTTVKSILRILANNSVVPEGEIFFKGQDVLKMKTAQVKQLRGSGVSMIFQDPTMSLNPVFTIGEQMFEAIRNSGQKDANKKDVQQQLAVQALRDTSMPDPERILLSYPFQLSGGMRQRVCIAMSLATPRDMVIADEPTTNLDVTIQDQVLRILTDRVESKHSSLILITHSLGVARETSDRIYVMYAGNMILYFSAIPTHPLPFLQQKTRFWGTIHLPASIHWKVIMRINCFPNSQAVYVSLSIKHARAAEPICRPCAVCSRSNCHPLAFYSIDLSASAIWMLRMRKPITKFTIKLKATVKAAA